MTSTGATTPAWQDHRLDVLLGTDLHRHMGLRPADERDPAVGVGDKTVATAQVVKAVVTLEDLT